MNASPRSCTNHLDFTYRGDARRSLGQSSGAASDRTAARTMLLTGLCALVGCCVIASDASGDGAPWQAERPQLGEFQELGDLGALTVDHISLGFQQPPSQRLDRLTSLEGGSRRGDAAVDSCLLDGRPSLALRDERREPSWASTGRGDCRRSSSRWDELIPRISIRGSFFSIGYGVELDKDTRTFLIDYGAFTFGVGDSPRGVAVFNGARFGLPRRFPGRKLIPRNVREDLQIDVGLSLLVDPSRPEKLRPQAGIGVTLAEW